MDSQNQPQRSDAERHARNEDPITGEPGSHPVAAGTGAAAGTIVGAVAGTAIGGPIGGVIGAVAAGIAGGLGGKAAGEVVDPTVEHAYWQENHAAQPYASEGSYEDFEPAYRSGYEGYNRLAWRKPKFEEVETDLRSDYERGQPRVSWEKARPATLSAFSRAYERHASSSVADRTDGPGTSGNL